MKAIAGFDIEPWDYLYFAEKVRKAKYDLDQNELKPYFELQRGARTPRSTWPSSCTASTSRESPATVPVFEPRRRVCTRSPTRPRASGRPLLRRLLRPRGQAVGRLDDHLPVVLDAGRFEADPGLEQQQLRQAGRRRAGADLARRRRDPVPRVRPRPALFLVGRELSGARQHAARLRRVSVAGARAVGADAADPRPLHEALQDRRSRCRRRWSTRSRPRPPSTRAMRRSVSVLGHRRHGPAHASHAADRHRRVREGHAGAHRHAQGDRDAAPPAAVQSPVHVRRLLGRLLQLPVVGGDGRRHLGLSSRSRATCSIRTSPGRFKSIILAPGNTTDRGEAYRDFRGRDPDVAALLRVRGFPVS